MPTDTQLTRNRPCPTGRALGEQLARFVAMESTAHYQKFPADPDMCSSCAFRAGTVPNGCLATTADALKSVIELSPFLCHSPERSGAEHPCMGWVILVCQKTDGPLIEAPWEFSGGVDDAD